MIYVYDVAPAPGQAPTAPSLATHVSPAIPKSQVPPTNAKATNLGKMDKLSNLFKIYLKYTYWFIKLFKYEYLNLNTNLGKMDKLSKGGVQKKKKKSVEFSTTWRGEGVKSGDFPQFFSFFFSF